MSKWEKLLDAMRTNPKADWTIGDVKTICKHLGGFGITLSPPKRGSHFTVRHPTAEILTIPARRPLKPIYVKLFVSMIDSIMSEVKDPRGPRQPTRN